MTRETFRPITRDMAAELLSVSLGTLDRLIEEGSIPKPRTVGSGRRLYWHPDVFHRCIALHLLGNDAPETRNPAAPGLPGPRHTPPTPTPPLRRHRAGSTSAEMRDALKLKALNDETLALGTAAVPEPVRPTSAPADKPSNESGN